MTTGYKEFMDWITAGRPSRFKQIDRDKSGTIGLQELIYCCNIFLREHDGWAPKEKVKLKSREKKAETGMHLRKEHLED